VIMVDMGHTHYNEIANDGRTIYATTRSTGQIEEGPVGFSIASLDDGVVSWKFKSLEVSWPFVMITAPADQAFIVDPSQPEQLVRGVVEVRAKAWDV
jgi:Icc protein